MKILLPLFTILTFNCLAQGAIKKGDIVPNLQVAEVLNYPAGANSISKLKGDITVIDFFGTWCTPCIKALPNLASLQYKFKEKLKVVLVSTESKNKLADFINKRMPFAFPIIVDEGNVFENSFKPASYPYSIVLDKNLKVISITNAADLTEEILQKFIDDGKNIKNISITTIQTISANNFKAMYNESNNALVKLSQQFMYAAKTNEDVSTFINELSALKYDELLDGLKNDDEKKAFWINLYNAYTNASLHKNPGQYKSRNKFFGNKNIVIAGKTFSLDEIEHGILRKSKIKWSLGYLSKLFPGKTEKDLRVSKLDYRIHFALNCGARSCPPIAFYNPENINNQLNVAAKAYLSSEASYHAESNILELPAILGWFRRDFGGKKKIVQLLKTKQLLPKDIHPKIKFKKYDWTLYLDNYKL